MKALVSFVVIAGVILVFMVAFKLLGFSNPFKSRKDEDDFLL